MKWYQLSENCLQRSFGDKLDEPTVWATLSAFQALESAPRLRDLGVVDLVPAYNKLAIYFNEHEANHQKIVATIEQLLHETSPCSRAPSGPIHTLQVDYRGEDLDRVATHCNLSTEELIARHTAPVYLVAMIGFQPHFPYLFGLDHQLATPRLETPRLQIPPGSVAIGEAQTGIYPATSPGGWNLIGTTDPAGLSTLRAGDRIRFLPGGEAS